MLDVKNVHFGYEEALLKDISFSVKKGEMIGIVGPNGSGKTTLLKIVSRILKQDKGEVLLHGEKISSYSRKKLSKEIAVLSQKSEESFSYSVYDTVSLGRYAHSSSLFSSWSKEDEDWVLYAMEKADILHLMDRDLTSLSGGEKQRVFLAQALAQQPSLLLLDEPTNHLDVAHSIQLFDFLQEWVGEKETAIVAIFHDLNLASLYCQRILVLHEGEVIVDDTPQRALREDVLRSIYHPSILLQPHVAQPSPIVTYVPSEKGREQQVDIRWKKEEGHYQIETSKPFKVLSTTAIGETFGWRRLFLQQRSKSSPSTEMLEAYVEECGFHLKEVVADGTSCGDWVTKVSDDGSVHLFVWAENEGSISAWLLITGRLGDQDFLQLMIRMNKIVETYFPNRETNVVVAASQTDGLGGVKGMEEMLKDALSECEQRMFHLRC